MRKPARYRRSYIVLHKTKRPIKVTADNEQLRRLSARLNQMDRDRIIDKAVKRAVRRAAWEMFDVYA